jgi:hypothetical protein
MNNFVSQLMNFAFLNACIQKEEEAAQACLNGSLLPMEREVAIEKWLDIMAVIMGADSYPNAGEA